MGKKFLPIVCFLVFIMLVLSTICWIVVDIFKELESVRFEVSNAENARELDSDEKCPDGSYYFKGYCYFVSNKRKSESKVKSFMYKKLVNISMEERDLLKNNQPRLPVVFDQDVWMASRGQCKFLNEQADLLTIENEIELDFVIGLLVRLNFKKNESVDHSKEITYQIGLQFKSKFSRSLAFLCHRS